MANDKLSAKEAALLAQARVELAKKPATQAGAAEPQPVAADVQRRTPRQAPARSSAGAAGVAPVARAAIQIAAPGDVERAAHPGATPAPAADPAHLIAVLMAAARDEAERVRRRQKMLYVWVPVAFMSFTGLWTLLWMWHKL